MKQAALIVLTTAIAAFALTSCTTTETATTTTSTTTQQSTRGSAGTAPGSSVDRPMGGSYSGGMGATPR